MSREILTITKSGAFPSTTVPSIQQTTSGIPPPLTSTYGGGRQNPRSGDPFGFASRLGRETLLQRWSHLLQYWLRNTATILLISNA
ncbi:hypothetical protein SD81_025100 [Tolypothrix campylonemoides VB511288]|nr:hypothetical protein SD81_025100 [Tolypothrix campylonemoides VB511288]